MTIISGVRMFDVAGVAFCEIPEGDVTISSSRDSESEKSLERVHVERFGLAQKPGANFELDDYSARMGNLTHGVLARRRSDGRPFVVERSHADGSHRTPAAGVIAFEESSHFLFDNGKTVRLVPDPKRYVERLGERAAYFMGPYLPATLVTPFEAFGWADFLAQESGRDVTLPTDIQWKYAAQGGERQDHASRRHVSPQEIIDYDGGPVLLNREGWEGFLNSFGLLDIIGGVWEPTLIKGPLPIPSAEYLESVIRLVSIPFEMALRLMGEPGLGMLAELQDPTLIKEVIEELLTVEPEFRIIRQWQGFFSDRHAASGYKFIALSRPEKLNDDVLGFNGRARGTDGVRPAVVF